MLKLYETEWLVYVDRGNYDECEYWVLRQQPPSPLFTRHKVRKRHVAIATALFKDHPDGIRRIKQEELRFLEGWKWNPKQSLEHKADANND